MAEAVVRSVAGEAEVRVEVSWRDATLNLLRGREEPVERFLVRLGISCGKHSSAAGGDRKRAKKERKKAPGAEVTATGIEVGLVDANGAQVPGNTPVADALKQGSRLEIGGESLPIFVNPPTINKLEVFGRPVAGCPLVASLNCEFCEPSSFRLLWIRQVEAGAGAQNMEGPYHGEGRVFMVPDDAVGHTIMVKAEASGEAPRASSAKAFCRVGLVESCPGGWAEARLAAFARPQASEAPAAVRVVSYNMLAAPYAQSQTAVQDLFPYCPPHLLDFAYRQPLLGRELKRLDGDIICLQECHYPTFRKFLVPLFGDSFHMRVTLKASRVSEGCALLVRKGMFQVLEEGDYRFREVFRSDPAFREVLREVHAKWPDFVKGVLPHMTTVFQLAALRHVPSGRVLVVGNTHLFFHPRARHIRLLQVMCLSHLLQDLRERFREGGDSGKLPEVIIGGDFNCSPHRGAIQMLLKGELSSEHGDWEFCRQFAWGRDDEEQSDIGGSAGAPADDATTSEDECGESSEHQLQALPEEAWQPGLGVKLQSPLGPLRDAYEGKELPFTNYVHNFKATLDYILHTGGLRSIKTLNGPSEEEVAELGGLPCVLHPSDHLSLAADLAME